MKRVLSIIAALLLTLTAAWAQPSGNWTDAGNYASEYKSEEVNGETVIIHIENAAQLARLAYENNVLNKYYTLTVESFLDADIDLSGHYWIPINYQGRDIFNRLKFKAQGHTISGMTVNNQVKAGLFGYSKYCIVQN